MIVIFILLSIPGACKGETASGRHPQRFAETMQLPDIPAEQALLTIVIPGEDGPKKIYLDAQTIIALPSTEFTALDPWGKGRHSYKGVNLHDLILWCHGEESFHSITVAARNDYSIEIQQKDMEKYTYILAYAIDGIVLPGNNDRPRKRDFIIAIDFDRHPDMEKQVYKHQLVWQVNRIVIHE